MALDAGVPRESSAEIHDEETKLPQKELWIEGLPDALSHFEDADASHAVEMLEKKYPGTVRDFLDSEPTHFIATVWACVGVMLHGMSTESLSGNLSVQFLNSVFKI